MDKLIGAIKKYTMKTDQSDSPSEIKGEFSFDKDFIGFSGHFPGYPILPAVLQLLIAQVLIEKQKGYKISVTRIIKAKFLSEIRPDARIIMHCVDADTDETGKSRITISCGERPVSSFYMNYKIKENSRC